MAYSVIATAEFDALLSEAVAFRIENYGLRSAKRLLDDVDGVCELLGNNPLVGRVVNDKDDRHSASALRWIRMGTYIAIYRVHESGQEIALLKLLSASSNWRRRVL